MESESKTEFNEGLENPEVGRDSKAEEIDKKSTNDNDLELSIDSSTETNLRNTHGNELAMYPDPHRDSDIIEGNEIHQEGTAALQGDVEECPRSSTDCVVVRMDEPNIAENSQSAAVVTVSSVEANQPVDVSEKTDSPICKYKTMEPNGAQSAPPESADGTFLLNEPIPDEECRNYVVSDDMVMASDKKEGLGKAAAITIATEEAMEPADISEKTDLPLRDDIIEPKVSQSAPPESADGTFMPGKQIPDEECSNRIVSDAMVVASDKKEGLDKPRFTMASEEAVQSSNVSKKTDLSLCDDKISEPKLTMSAPESYDSRTMPEKTIPGEQTRNLAVSDIKEVKSDTAACELLETVPVMKPEEANVLAEVPKKTEVPASEDEIMVLKFPSSATPELSDNTTPFVPEIPTLEEPRNSVVSDVGKVISDGKGPDIQVGDRTVSKQSLNDSENKSTTIANGNHCLEEQDSGAPERKSPLLDAHTYRQAPEHKNYFNSEEDQKEPAKSDNTSDIDQIHFVKESTPPKDPNHLSHPVTVADEVELEPLKDKCTQDEPLEENGRDGGEVSIKQMHASSSDDMLVDDVAVQPAGESRSEKNVQTENLVDVNCDDASGVPVSTEKSGTGAKTLTEISINVAADKTSVVAEFPDESSTKGKVQDERMDVDAVDIPDDAHVLIDHPPAELDGGSQKCNKKHEPSYSALCEPPENDTNDETVKIGLEGSDPICEQAADPAPVTLSDDANFVSAELDKMSINELEKYYKWCNQGLSSREAISKAMVCGLIPESLPHPNCKHSWEKIKEMSDEIPEKHFKQKFLVETFYGGKEPEEVMKIISKIRLTEGPSGMSPTVTKNLDSEQEVCIDDSLQSKKECEDDGESKSGMKAGTEKSCSNSECMEGETTRVAESSLEVGSKQEREHVRASKVHLEDGGEQYGSDPECIKRETEPIAESSLEVGSKQESAHGPNCEGYLKCGAKKSGSDSECMEGGTTRVAEASLEVGSKQDREHGSASEDYLKCGTEKSGSGAGTIEGKTDPVGELRPKVGIAPGTLSAKAVSAEAVPSAAEPTKPSVSRVNIGQLKRFYQWCNQGLSSREALVKALDSTLTPPTEDPHPNCKLPFKEIKEITLLLPAKKCRSRFLVETFFGGKDLEEQLKLSLAQSSTRRHPNCKQSWEQLKKMSSQLPEECSKWKFIVEIYCKGKKPDEVMKTVSCTLESKSSELSNLTGKQVTRCYKGAAGFSEAVVNETEPGPAPHVEHPPECKLPLLSNVEPIDRPSTSRQGMAELADMENIDGSKPKNIGDKWMKLDEWLAGTTEISKLGLNQLKKYYKWCNLGLSSGEALSRAKEPGVVPQTEDPHPNCRLPWEELKQISLLIPAKHPRSKFLVETFFGGKDPEEQLKLMLSSSNTERHPDCKHTWEDLKKMSEKLPKESTKFKFIVEAFYGGKNPEESLKATLPKNSWVSSSSQTAEDTSSLQKVVSSSHDKVPDESISEQKISKLSLNQLKKYYKWRILGLGCSEAIVKAKEPGLIPQTEDHHPNCKLPWEEIKQISLLVPSKHPRTSFQVETFFGGKDPEEQLKRILSKANTERHPNCKHTWEDLKKMSSELPKESLKYKFIVDSFYGGKSPAELLKSMLSNVNVTKAAENVSTGDVHFVDGTVKKAAKRVRFVDNTEVVDSSCELTGTCGMLSSGKRKIYILYRKAGFDHENAYSKASNFETYPGKHSPNSKRKLPEEEPKKIGSDRSLIHTVGNKPGGSADKNITFEDSPLANGKLKYYYLWRNKGHDHETALSKVSKYEPFRGTHYPHPNCKLSQDQLRHISLALESNMYEWDRFIIYTFYGGKDPEITLRYFMSCLGIDYQREDISAEGSSDEDLLILEKAKLNNKALRKYYLWRNCQCDHKTALSKVRSKEPLPSFHLTKHPSCKHSQHELRQMSQALMSNKFQWDRYVIHTFNGGRDPEDTLKHFMSRSRTVPAESSQQAKKKPLPFEPVAKRTRSCPDSGIIPLDSPNHPSKELDDSQLKNYYLWINHGCSREEAMIKAKTSGLFPKNMPSRCLVPKQELSRISQKLPPGRCRDLFLIETYYGGNDPEEVLEYLLSKLGGNSDSKPPQTFPQKPQVIPQHRSNQDGRQLTQTSPQTPKVDQQFRSNQDGRQPPQTSPQKPQVDPQHRSNQDGHQLPQTSPQKPRVDPQHRSNQDGRQPVQTSSQKPKVDPQHRSNQDGHQLPQTSAQKPEVDPQHGSNQVGQKNVQNKPTDDEVRFANCGLTDTYSNPTVIEEGPICQLSNGELKYYYRWRNEGFDLQRALLNVKKQIKIPGMHFRNPHCKYSEAELRMMSASLGPIEAERYFVHTYFGGKDPGCTYRFFAASSSPLIEANKASNLNPILEEQQLQQHEKQFLSTAQGFPAVPSPYGHPAAGLPTAPYQHPAVGPPPAFMPPYELQGFMLPYELQAAGPPSTAYPQSCTPVSTPSMVYPPNHFHTAGIVDTIAHPPYRQLVPGPPDVAYPSTMVCPPPQASVAYSGYPNAAGPSGAAYPPTQPQGTLPPPIHQQPSPTVNTASNANNTKSEETVQSQLHKAGQPLVGKHDSLHSSLKRKSTDELPIKIKLKALSDEPKRPKPIRKEELPSDADGSAPLFIVPTAYPSESLTESQMDAIESNLLEAILEMDDDGTKPSFKDSCRSKGRYGITCVDQFSVSWLYKYLSTYQPWPGASLKLISSLSGKVRANAILPACGGDDDKKILKFIERQNKGLNVSTWKVIQRWNNGEFNTCMDLVIDEESAEVLKKCSRISFKLGSAEIITSDDATPPKSRLGDQNTSKNLSDPSERQPPATSLPSYPARSSPPPPPPKCIRSGEGYPSLPNRSSTTSPFLGSSSTFDDQERPKRVQEDSPHQSSACGSPSPMRVDHLRSPLPSYLPRSSSSPLPPPPKCIRSGEGYPILPKRSSTTDTALGSPSRSGDREHPKRVQDDSRSSACRSPSQDRFGRPVSKAKSPIKGKELSRSDPRTASPSDDGQKHSWMDWFYSKEDKKPASKSPSRDRSPLPKAYLETKHSRRERRRSDSRSLSPKCRRSSPRNPSSNRYSAKSSYRKKRRRASSTSPSSSSDEHSSSRRRRVDSHQKPSRY